MKRMDALLATGFLLLFTAGCGGSGAEENASASGGGGGDIGGGETPISAPTGEACYAGKDGSGICLPAINMVSHPDYQYANPFTDPSFPAGSNPNQYRKPVRIIDLSLFDGRELLAPHFQAVELMNVDRGRYGFFSPAVLRIIEDMRVSVASPMHINSAYRTPARNGSVGGVKWSRHVYGDAIDFYSPGASLTRLRDACIRHGASFYQLYQTHIHCDWRARALEPAFFGESFSGAEATLADIVGTFHEQNAPKTEIAAVSVGGEVRLEASGPFQEDEGELTMEWSVRTPSGDVFKTQERAITLPKESGSYSVDVVIGGSLEIKGREVRVP